MNRYLKKFFLFILPILALAYPADLYFSNTLKKDHGQPGAIEIMNDIFSGRLDADIAVYGSSRAFYHFNTKIMEDSLKRTVYNFGFVAYNFWLQYFRHIEFLKYNRKPETIILSLDLFSFADKDDLSGEIQLLPFMLWNKDIYNYTRSFKGVKNSDFFIPMARYFGNLNSLDPVFNITIKGEAKTRYAYRGFKGINLTWNGDLSLRELAENNFRVKFNPDCIRLFDHFLEECKTKRIKVILVYSPEYFTRREYAINREEVIAYFRSVARKFDIHFIDFSSDEMCKDNRYFYNGLHLNLEGANLFTRKLVARLKRL